MRARYQQQVSSCMPDERRRALSEISPTGRLNDRDFETQGAYLAGLGNKLRTQDNGRDTICTALSTRDETGCPAIYAGL